MATYSGLIAFPMERPFILAKYPNSTSRLQLEVLSFWNYPLFLPDHGTYYFCICIFVVLLVETFKSASNLKWKKRELEWVKPEQDRSPLVSWQPPITLMMNRSTSYVGPARTPESHLRGVCRTRIKFWSFDLRYVLIRIKIAKFWTKVCAKIRINLAGTDGLCAKIRIR